MSGDHAKKEMETGEKAKAMGRPHQRSSVSKARRNPLFAQVASEWRQEEEEDEESGLLRDRLFVALHLRLRRGVRHF
jgi:hypothetical protein